MATIRYLDTSPDFNPAENTLNKIIKVFCKKEVQVIYDKNREVDLEIVSNNVEISKIKKMFHRLQAEKSYSKMEDYHKCFRLGFRPNYSNPAKKRIWFTGENLRPPIKYFDATFSCDLNDPEINNVFFPFWYLYLLRLTFDNKFHFDHFLSARKPVYREVNAVTFSSNYESKRIQIVNAIEKIIPVTKFGRYHQNYTASKANVSKDFGFQICNENDLYPNYVTEKLFDSWISRNVPIWAGFDSLGYFNQEAFINVTGFESNQISEYIKNISHDEMMYRQSQPLLNKIPDLSVIIATFENLLR
jgi:hypothetical protein